MNNIFGKEFETFIEKLEAEIAEESEEESTADESTSSTDDSNPVRIL